MIAAESHSIFHHVRPNTSFAFFIIRSLGVPSSIARFTSNASSHNRESSIIRFVFTQSVSIIFPLYTNNEAVLNIYVTFPVL